MHSSSLGGESMLRSFIPVSSIVETNPIAQDSVIDFADCSASTVKSRD